MKKKEIEQKSSNRVTEEEEDELKMRAFSFVGEKGGVGELCIGVHADNRKTRNKITEERQATTQRHQISKKLLF